MKFIKILVVMVSLISLVGIGNATADATGFTSDACSGAQFTATATCTTAGQDALSSLAKTVVDILSIIIGIVAVIMIIISGLRFITAGGDTNAVAAAKNTLIYALIGLVVAVLAQLLVHLVLNTAGNIQQKSDSYNNYSLVIKNDA